MTLPRRSCLTYHKQFQFILSQCSLSRPTVVKKEQAEFFQSVWVFLPLLYETFCVLIQKIPGAKQSTWFCWTKDTLTGETVLILSLKLCSCCSPVMCPCILLSCFLFYSQTEVSCKFLKTQARSCSRGWQ